MLVDSHCHLDRLNYASKHVDIADAVAKASARGVSHLLCVSVTLEQFPSMLAKIAPFPQVFASCGVHPLDQESPWSPELLRQLAAEPRVVAIGETGLDYHWDKSPKDIQKEIFRKQIALAKRVNRGLISDKLI